MIIKERGRRLGLPLSFMYYTKIDKSEQTVSCGIPPTHCDLLDPHLFKQGLYVGLMTSEAHIERHGVL